MKYNAKIVCDVCGNEIQMPHARIEWNFNGYNMRICHHDCSHGLANDVLCLSDIILDQGLYDAERCYKKLQTIKIDFMNYKIECDRLIELIFSK